MRLHIQCYARTHTRRRTFLIPFRPLQRSFSSSRRLWSVFSPKRIIVKRIGNGEKNLPRTGFGSGRRLGRLWGFVLKTPFFFWGEYFYFFFYHWRNAVLKLKTRCRLQMSLGIIGLHEISFSLLLFLLHNNTIIDRSQEKRKEKYSLRFNP